MIKAEQYKQNIPMELRQYKQWLWFKRIRKIDLKGKEKILKLPVSPITFKSDDWNNKEQWADFETAVNNLESSGCDGLSFVLSRDDPFVCIDLDNVEENILKMFQTDFNDTYKEISQSGNGVHIFVKGQIEKNFNNQLEKVEMYQENRCIVMTGNIYKLNDFVAEKVLLKQKELDKYYKLFSPKRSVREIIRKYQEVAECVPDSNTVIETMCRYNTRARALFEGSYTSGDASKDDFSLLIFLNSFTHGNAEMMKELFLKSALNRIGDRSKRRTEKGYLKYLEDSISKAIQGGNKRYWDYNYHRSKGGYWLE